jgi:hypothetical protein
MACFVCDERPTDFTDTSSECSDCPRCRLSITLNWKNHQWILKHMGAHIQHNTLLNSSEEQCGLCLHPAPMCQLYLQKVCGVAGSVSVDCRKSKCINLINFNYATASTSSESSPCSNIPTTCPLCPDGSPAEWTHSLHAHF